VDFFSNWLLSHTLTTAAQTLVSALFSNDLRKRLTQSAEEWRLQLPSDAELLSIEALLPRPSSGLIDNPPPQPNEIFNRLEKYEIPSAADWSTALLRQWRWVSETLEQPQAFFRLPESRAKTHVEELATRLELECQKDAEIFRVQSLKNDEAQLHAIETVSAKLDSERRATSTQDAVIETRIERLLTKLESGEEKAATKSNFHAQIDHAVEYTQNGQPDVAIAQLEDLRKHRWDDLDDRQRFRVIANIGHAYDAKEERTTAARHFIECKEYQPDDEKARCLEAIGYSMLGENQRAFDLSVQVRSDFPTSDLGTATWIRSASDEMMFDEIEGDIARHLRQNVETAFALSVRASKSGKFGKAEEYARTALADDEDSAMLLENLGIVLLESSRVEAAAQYAERPNISNSGRLEEALGLLEKSLEKTPNVTATRARIRFYLGITLQLLGKWDEGEDHLHAAYDAHPTNVEYSRQYALALCDRGDKDRAISILKSTSDNDDSRQSLVLLAHLLAARNKSDDRDEAARLLTGEFEHLTEIDRKVRSDIVATLVDLHGLIGRHDEAARVLEQPTAAALCPEALHAIRAAQLHRAGEHALAQQECRKALASISADTDRREKRRVATELMHLGMYEEALSLWRELAEPSYLGIDTPALLQAAMQCDDDKYIVQFCAELRANGIVDREAFHLEIDTLQEYNCFDTASTAMQQYLAAHTETELSKEIRVRLSHLGIALGRDDLVDYDQSHLPSVDAVDPGLGLAVVEVLSHGPEPIRGVEYAYDLLRRNFSSHLAHKAMVVAFLFGRRADLKLPEPETAGPGVAVRYKDNETGQLHWYIIEDSPDPDPARDEYPSEHGLAEEMGGKRQGEAFWLRRDPVHERTATIIDIWSKYKFRFNRCMEEWENRFPEHFFLWKFEAKKDEHGKADFSQMFRSIDDRIAKTREREEVYRNNPFSATNFAIMAGGTVLESVQHLGANQDLPIRCSAGTDEDYAAAEEAIRLASPVILDGAALATLFISGFYRELVRLPLKYVVTHGTLHELRRRYLEKLNSPQEGGFMTKQDDQFILIEEKPEDVERRLGAFGHFLETIESVARIEEGLALAECDRQRRTEWIEICGRAGAETIALAQLNGYVLWTDDVCISAIANQDQPLPRVWTESVAEWAFNEKKVTLQTRNQLIIMLVSHGYHYTRMHPETALWAAEQSEWKTDDTSFEAVLRWLSNPFTKPIGILGIAAKLLLEASRRIDSPFRMDEVNTQILSRVSQRPDGRKIIQELLNRMDEICGLDVVTARNLKLTIHAWRATRL